MNSLEPTKLALVRILQILEQYSDFDHPLKQQDIIDYLDKDYGIVIERKAVGRNLSLLKRAGEPLYHRQAFQRTHRAALFALQQVFPFARQKHLVGKRMEQDG